jgi:hypothetical protein
MACVDAAGQVLIARIDVGARRERVRVTGRIGEPEYHVVRPSERREGEAADERKQEATIGHRE